MQLIYHADLSAFFIKNPAVFLFLFGGTGGNSIHFFVKGAFIISISEYFMHAAQKNPAQAAKPLLKEIVRPDREAQYRDGLRLWHPAKQIPD